VEKLGFDFSGEFLVLALDCKRHEQKQDQYQDFHFVPFVLSVAKARKLGL
jgi:hypothetical protein